MRNLAFFSLNFECIYSGLFQLVVLHFQFGKRTLLFTGDIGVMVEEWWAEDWPEAEVLKVPHHGSITSSSRLFLTKIQPLVAIVSCGEENHFGLPHSSVVQRYEDLGIPLLRTDIDGAVALKTTGKDWILYSAHNTTKRLVRR